MREAAMPAAYVREACTPQGRARCHGDGEYSAEDGSRAEAREPVDGAEREGCDQGATADTTPQAFDRPEHEPAPQNLDHTEAIMTRPETVMRVLLCP